MAFLFKAHPKFEKIYKAVDSILPHSSYCRIDNSNSLPREIVPKIDLPFVTVWASTDASNHPSYLFENFQIQAGSLIPHQRIYRYCCHNGQHHLNVEDNLYCLEESGNIVRFSRKDSSDHFISVSNFSDTKTIIERYSLPIEKSGAISNFFSHGAFLPEMVTFKELDNGNT